MRIRRKRRSPLAPRVGAAGVFVAIGAAVFALLRRMRPPGGGSESTPASGSVSAGETEWTCDCGKAYAVNGSGRHRVVWPKGGDQRDAVLGDACPSCERPLAPELVASAA